MSVSSDIRWQSLEERERERDNSLAKVKKYIRIASVRLLSMTSTSFEKRLTMRPMGVVSKNDIGALSVFPIAFCISTLLLLVPAIVRVNAKPNISTLCATPSAANTPIWSDH